MAVRIQGPSGNTVDINSSNQLKVIPEPNAAANPFLVGAVKIFSENDPGSKTGEMYLYSPETDDDYRLRIAQDTLIDAETFNYAAQNTSKHTYTNSTMTITWNASGLTTNGGNVTTTNLGCTMGTYAEFPLFGSTNIYCEMEASFSNQPVSNSNIDFGMFRRGSSTQYVPTDGVYFRMSADGLQGVLNYNGTETLVPFTTPFTYTNNQKYQFIISVNQREIKFWIDGILYAEKETPVGVGQPFISHTLPFSIRQGTPNGAAAGGVINFNLNNYAITIGGINFSRDFNDLQNSILGSYQGLSGGTIGQLVSGTVTTGTLVKPSAVVPANNSLTAGLGTGLGGRSWETYTTPIGTNTDAVICAYLNPAGTIAIQGKRLKITGVKMSGSIQTVMVGGPFVQEWYIMFGGTAISLQTAEAAAAKPCRRIMLPEFTQIITAAQAASTIVYQPSTVASFDQPIYVNPGEYVGLVNNWFGTAPTAGVIAYTYQFVYSWE